MGVGTYKQLLVLLLAILTLGSCKTKQKPAQQSKTYYYEGSTRFIKAMDLTEAIDMAAAKNKPLFVEFVADWCLPCKVIKEEVFTHRETANFLNDNFLNYELDVETGSGANMKYLFQVDQLPTVLFLDGKGKELSRLEGSFTQTELVESGKRALTNWNTTE